MNVLFESAQRLVARWYIVYIAFLCSPMAVGWGAEEKPSLWNLVSNEAGVVIECRRLAEEVRKFPDSPIRHRLESHSIWKAVLSSSEWKRFAEIESSIHQVTEASLRDWVVKLLGEEFLIAIYADADNQPKSVVLTHIETPGTWSAALQAWEKLESRNEAPHIYRGVTYFSKSRKSEGSAKSSETIFYVTLGKVVALSDQEYLITKVIDRSLEAPVEKSEVTAAPRLVDGLKLLHPNSFIRILVQPPVWHRNQSSSAVITEDVGERLIRAAWKNSELIAISGRLDQGIVLEFTATSKALLELNRWQQLVTRVSGQPKLLQRIPVNAIVSFTGRHDLAGIADWVQTSLPAELIKKWHGQRQVLRGFLMGLDLVKDVFPALPGDFGGYVVPRSELDSAQIPVDGLIAVSMPSDALTAVDAREKKVSIAVETAIENAIKTGFHIIAALYNSSSNEAADAEVEESDLNGIKVNSIMGLGGFQPAFAMTKQFLLLGTSPQVIKAFLQDEVRSAENVESIKMAWRKSVMVDASQILEFRSDVAVAYIKSHREFFAEQLKAVHHLKLTDARKRLDRMVEWGQLSDTVIVATQFLPKSVKCVLGIAVMEHAKP